MWLNTCAYICCVIVSNSDIRIVSDKRVLHRAGTAPDMQGRGLMYPQARLPEGPTLQWLRRVRQVPQHTHLNIPLSSSGKLLDSN